MYKTVYITILGALLSVNMLIAAELSPGEGVYLKYCVSCHGNQGNGKGTNGIKHSPAASDFRFQRKGKSGQAAND